MGPVTCTVFRGTAASGTGTGAAAAEEGPGRPGAGVDGTWGLGAGASAGGVGGGVSGEWTNSVWYRIRRPAINRAATIARFSIRPAAPSRLTPLSWARSDEHTS